MSQLKQQRKHCAAASNETLAKAKAPVEQIWWNISIFHSMRTSLLYVVLRIATEFIPTIHRNVFHSFSVSMVLVCCVVWCDILNVQPRPLCIYMRGHEVCRIPTPFSQSFDWSFCVFVFFWIFSFAFNYLLKLNARIGFKGQIICRFFALYHFAPLPASERDREREREMGKISVFRRGKSLQQLWYAQYTDQSPQSTHTKKGIGYLLTHWAWNARNASN